jgi:glutaredoxin
MIIHLSMFYFIFMLMGLSYGYSSNLPQKGIIIVARSEECRDLDRLTRHLDSMRSAYKVISTKKDPVLDRYIKKHYPGLCPLVFVDNIYRGSTRDFIFSLDDEVLNSAWI